MIAAESAVGGRETQREARMFFTSDLKGTPMQHQTVSSRKAKPVRQAEPTPTQRKLAEALLMIGRKAVAEAKARGRYRADAQLEWDAYGLPK